jgi:hypothetical protein
VGRAGERSDEIGVDVNRARLCLSPGIFHLNGPFPGLFPAPISQTMLSLVDALMGSERLEQLAEQI